MCSIMSTFKCRFWKQYLLHPFSCVQPLLDIAWYSLCTCRGLNHGVTNSRFQVHDACTCIQYLAILCTPFLLTRTYPQPERKTVTEQGFGRNAGNKHIHKQCLIFLRARALCIHVGADRHTSHTHTNKNVTPNVTI